MTFIDRIEELRELEDRWGPRPQLYLLWGRRRVGKSALIREFARGKDAIIYQAVTGTAADQLSLLTRRIRAWRDDPVLAAAPLVNWDQAFAYLEGLGRTRRSQGSPLLLVFDEVQYLDEADASIISRLQEFLEVVKHDDLPLFIVIAGSSISFFEERILIGKVFGRRTAGGLLAPLGYRDGARFFPSWTPVDQVRAWAVLGGMPYYLEQFDPERSLAWNIRQRILRRNQVLYNEAELLLRDELRDAPTYLSVLSAIAGGDTKVSDIHARTRVPVTSLSSILRRLERLHLIERMVPVTEDAARSKRGLWLISDNYLAFWFRFVRPNAVELEAGRADDIWADEVAPNLDRFVSKPAFERLCRAFVRDGIGRDRRLPSRGSVGAWWGGITESSPGGPRTVQRESEVVVIDGRRLVLVGEAKWTDGRVGREALDQLRRTASSLPGYEPGKTRLALFARDAFSDDLRRAEADGEVLLLTARDMLEVAAA